jgi:hypothetical protein
VVVVSTKALSWGALEVLDLVEQQIGGLAALRHGVERRPQHARLVPVDEAEDRLGDAGQLGQFVGLETEDVAWRYSPRQEIRQDLELCRGLADLPRTAHDYGRCQPELETTMDL